MAVYRPITTAVPSPRLVVLAREEDHPAANDADPADLTEAEVEAEFLALGGQRAERFQRDTNGAA